MTKKQTNKELLELGRLAEQKLLKDLAAKVAEGKAGVAEAKQIRTMIEQIEAQSAPQGKLSSFLVSTKKAAEFFNVDPRTISNWNAAGCPKVKYGWFDLKAMLEWWIENIQDNAADASDETIRHYRQQYEKWRAEKIRIEVETIKGLLFEKAEVIQKAVIQAQAVKTGLEALENRLAPILVGKTLQEIRQIIYNEVRGMLFNWADHDEFLPQEVREDVKSDYETGFKQRIATSQGGRGARNRD
ncbi:hypothetical protein JXQ70_19825 [bacterium]|nr:hypothetical protein [bacterium]